MTSSPTNGPARPKTPMAGVTFGLIAALIWGAWPVFSRFGVENSLSVFDVTALRFSVAGLVLLPLVWRHATKGLGWARASVLSCGAGAPYVLVMVTGLSYAPAGHAGVITPSCMLIFSTIGSRFILRDQISLTRTLGIMLIMCGLVIIRWEAFRSYEGSVWVGDVMFGVGGLLWASYTVSSRYWQVEPLQATALVSVISMAVYLPIYFVTTQPQLLTFPPMDILAQAVFQGLIAGIVALLCYTRALSILGVGRGALFSALVPGIAIILAIPVLGELPTPFVIVGLACVTLGMVVALGFKDWGITHNLFGLRTRPKRDRQAPQNIATPPVPEPNRVVSARST